ncbi:aminoglycoside phosphotransferase family protein [Corallococcus sp. EGB]|uniref:aminoglycoside phosphotransferase family protein n=1 Tax=Corallococcus sp. EGB TaxID=1521117 RepID=UPI001CBBC0FD|nr:aminoglycoside phosphotransferase family protein [Corallococcus sp. EGB]
MLVYGDHPRTLPPAEVLGALKVRLRRLDTLPPGLEWHAELVTLFIEASVLAQGLLDADAEAAGEDEAGPGSQSWLALPLALAKLLAESWTGVTRQVTASLERSETRGQSPRPIPSESLNQGPWSTLPEPAEQGVRATKFESLGLSSPPPWPESLRQQVLPTRPESRGWSVRLTRPKSRKWSVRLTRPVSRRWSVWFAQLESLHQRVPSTRLESRGWSIRPKHFASLRLNARPTQPESLRLNTRSTQPESLRLNARPTQFESRQHPALPALLDSLKWSALRALLKSLGRSSLPTMLPLPERDSLPELLQSQEQSALSALIKSLEQSALSAPIKSLEQSALPSRVTLKEPEGYAHFALYPELYLEAVRSARLAGSTRVVGVRSIGTGLACIIASGLGSDMPPVTVRPVGPPFERRLCPGPRLTRELEAMASADAVAIVDEGPGLSGSSFGAVADFLEVRGMARERLHFFPSHAGAPGPMASEHHRTRWAHVHRHPPDFDTCAARLASWVEDLTGPAIGPLEDIGAGAWRRHLFPDPRDWPAVHVQQERRKYLLTTERGTFLLRFAGLGVPAEHRVHRARQLAEAGFTPPVLGLRHGFLVQPWMKRSRPLTVAREQDRTALLGQAGRYLGFRARSFSAPEPGRGASMCRLLEMARYNTAQALGEGLARALDAWTPHLAALTQAARPVETDHKLHAWEWLILPGGPVLKTDAVDHHAGLDLVGCQDVAWDIVGAAVELELSEPALATRVEHNCGHRVSPGLLRFYRPCYLAFQCGHHTLAAAALESVVPEEATRLHAAAARYATRLREVLNRSPAMC